MEKIRKDLIYKIMIYERDITYDILIKYGYSVVEVETLISEGIISKNDEDTYSLIDLNGFREYGKELVRRNCFTEANICFSKLYKMNPNDREVCLELLIGKLKRKTIDYKEILEIFGSLDKIDYDINMFDNNLYLYLLSFITEIPVEYKDREIIDFIDLTNDKGLMREVKFEISRSKFTFARKKLSLLMQEKGNNTAANELLSVLLSKVIDRDKKFKRGLIERAKNKQYAMIIKILEYKKQNKYLSTLESYVLLICEAIVEIIRTNKIPVPTINYTMDTYEALIGSNFKLALELNDRFITKIGGRKEDDAVNILLVDLNKLIEDIKNEYQEQPLVAGQLSLQLSPDMDYSGYNAGDNEVDKEIRAAEEIAYHITSANLTIEDARKTFGLKPEVVLLIKLVYARDYYIGGNNIEGDRILEELEKVSNKTTNVLYFLDRVKAYRDNHVEPKNYGRVLKPKEAQN